MPSSCFDNFPTELLQVVASLLDARELCLFRLSCKRIHEGTRGHFARACFQTLYTDLSLTKLERLKVIASNPELAPHVYTLVVRARPDGVLGEGLPWSRHPLGYLLPEQGIQQWIDILHHLVNCTSFSLVRDGWSDKNKALDHLTPTDAITVILKAITEACIPVQKFLVDFKPSNRSGNCELDMRRINVPDTQDPGFITAWANLQALQLNFTMNPRMTTNWVIPLVQHATGLRKLAIQFDRGREAEAIIEHLSSIDTPSQLQELTLRSASKINSARLSGLLRRHRDSICVLDMHSIVLDSTGWKSIFQMVGEFPLLESFLFSSLKEDYYYVHFPIPPESLVTDKATEFSFRPKMLKGQSVNISASCRGPSANVIVQKLAEATVLAY